VVDLLNSDNNANVIGIEPDRTEKEASFSDPASETSSDDNQSEPKETRRLISSIADMQPFEAMRGAYNPDTNEKYIGDALLQKTYTVSVLDKKRVPNNGLVPKYYVEGSHEAIIDKDTFLRVQAELLEAGSDQSLIEDIGDAIINLREERQSILTEAALKHDLQERMEDLISFLDEQTEAVTEYSEPLARRLIEKITLYDEKLVVEFKSGLTVEVEE